VKTGLKASATLQDRRLVLVRAQMGHDLVRTFICIELPEPVKQKMEVLENQLRAIDAQVSWVKPGNVHLTLKFLGGVPPQEIDGVSQAAERAARGTAPFEVEVGGAGCFPSPRSPRVLWVGLAVVPDPLINLYKRLEEELAPLGFEREKRRFAPHLTIGRLRSPRNGSELAQKLISIGFEPQQFVAREVIVMRSQLKPTGSIYTPLSIIPLQ
jgi:2'-5' RNA ligase